MGCRKQECVRAACLFIIGSFGLSLSSVNASVITSGCAVVNVACTLEELSSGANIEVNGVTFESWSVVDGSNNPVSLADVDVVGLDDQSSNVGLAFAADGSLSTVGLDLIDITINFGATISASAQRISGVSFALTDFAFGAANNGGFIFGSEEVSDNASAPIGDILIVEADNAMPLFFDLSDSTTFGPTSALSIKKTIELVGDADDDTVSLTRFEQRFTLTSVPEPITFVLFISGLLSLIWSRRIKRYSFEPLR